jgi:hypothetical protein
MLVSNSARDLYMGANVLKKNAPLLCHAIYVEGDRGRGRRHLDQKLGNHSFMARVIT